MGVRPSRVGAILSAMAAQVGLAAAAASLTAEEEAFIKPLWRIFRTIRERASWSVGPHHPAEMHAMALAINDKIGAIGSTLTLVEEPTDEVNHFDSLADLTKQLKAKQINTLVILGGNPAYDAPTDLDFAGAVRNAKTSIHLSLYDNETSHACTWHVPRAHYLEAWGDSRAWDGTASICQPLIEPFTTESRAIRCWRFLPASRRRNPTRSCEKHLPT